MEPKVPCPDFMNDGNVFAILGATRRALRRAGYRQEAKEVTERVQSSESYDEALVVMMEYVEPFAGDNEDLALIRED